MKPFLALLEKVVATYVQAFISILVIGDSINVSTAQALAIASIPAALTVLANGLPVIPLGLPFYADLVLRVVRTYVVAFLGLLVAVPTFRLDYSVAVAANAAALPAALAVLKGALASKVGRPDSAALLPASVDLPASAAA